MKELFAQADRTQEGDRFLCNKRAIRVSRASCLEYNGRPLRTLWAMAEKDFAERLLRGLLVTCSEISFVAALLMAVGGAGVLICQCGFWLREGRWTYFTVGNALGDPPRSTWSGAGQIIEWIWLQPLWAGLFAAGWLALGLSVLLYNAVKKA